MEIEIDQATGLLEYLGRVAWLDGEEVIITKKGKPYLKLVTHPDGSPSVERQGTRGISPDKGQTWVASDLPETSQEIIDAFEGKWSNDFS